MANEKLSSKELDEQIELSSQGLTTGQRVAFLNITDKTGFRAYAKKNKKTMQKLIRKVKRKVQKYDYNTNGQREPEEKKYVKPERKKQPEKKIVEKEKPARKLKGYKTLTKKELKALIKSSTSKTNKQKFQRALDNNVKASKFEITKGLNSKAAGDYRERYGKPRQYQG